MKFLRSPILVYTFLLILYYILTMIFPHEYGKSAQAAERIFPQITMGLIGIISLVLVFTNANKLINSKFCGSYFLYFILGLVYIFFTIDGTTVVSNFIYFLKLDMALLSLFAYYLFLGQNKELAKKCIFILYLVQVFYGIETLISDKLVSIEENAEAFDTNAGFILVSCIPMTLLLRKERLRIYIYLILVLACLVSGQRSAAVAAVLTVPIAYRCLINTIKKKDKILILSLGVLSAIPVIISAVNNIMVRNAMDAERGDIGSGRSLIWVLLLVDFFDQNVIHQLFGNGYISPQQLLGKKFGMEIEAHSGWIQNLYVYGFFGLILYAKTIFSMLKYNPLANRLKLHVKNVLLLCFFLFFIKCSTSHGNWDITVMPFSLVLAIVADDIRRFKVRKVSV